MHTFTGEHSTFSYNSDMSGTVIISRNGIEIVVPAEDLIAFVANFVRIKKIEQLDNTTDSEILYGEVE